MSAQLLKGLIQLAHFNQTVTVGKFLGKKILSKLEKKKTSGNKKSCSPVYLKVKSKTN